MSHSGVDTKDSSYCYGRFPSLFVSECNWESPEAFVLITPTARGRADRGGVGSVHHLLAFGASLLTLLEHGGDPSLQMGKIWAIRHKYNSWRPHYGANLFLSETHTVYFLRFHRAEKENVSVCLS